MRFFSLFVFLASLLPAQSPAVLAALATGTYFPLDVGDRWVYRLDDRLNMAQYQTWRVDRAATQGGNTYSVIAIEGPDSLYAEYWFRADSSGRVYILTGNGDQIFLDPTIVGPNSGEVQLTAKGGAVATPLGTFPDTVSYANPMGLEYETGVLARGLGVLSSTTDMETGSSGGPTLIRTVIEAEVAGAIRFPALEASMELGMESLSLNVSGKQVTNCAVPCYFVACISRPGPTQPAPTSRARGRGWRCGTGPWDRVGRYGCNCWRQRIGGLRPDIHHGFGGRRECQLRASAPVLGAQPASAGGRVPAFRQKRGRRGAIVADRADSVDTRRGTRAPAEAGWRSLSVCRIPTHGDTFLHAAEQASRGVGTRHAEERAPRASATFSHTPTQPASARVRGALDITVSSGRSIYCGPIQFHRRSQLRLL